MLTHLGMVTWSNFCKISDTNFWLSRHILLWLRIVVEYTGRLMQAPSTAKLCIVRNLILWYICRDLLLLWYLKYNSNWVLLLLCRLLVVGLVLKCFQPRLSFSSSKRGEITKFALHLGASANFISKLRASRCIARQDETLGGCLD